MDLRLYRLPQWLGRVNDRPGKFECLMCNPGRDRWWIVFDDLPGLRVSDRDERALRSHAAKHGVSFQNDGVSWFDPKPAGAVYTASRQTADEALAVLKDLGLVTPDGAVVVVESHIREYVMLADAGWRLDTGSTYLRLVPPQPDAKFITATRLPTDQPINITHNLTLAVGKRVDSDQVERLVRSTLEAHTDDLITRLRSAPLR